MQLLLAVLGVDGGDQHTAALLAHHLPGRQVHDGNKGLADQLLGLIVGGDAGEDLTIRAGAVVQREFQQLLGLLHGLAVLDLDGTEVGLAESIEVHALLGEGLHLHSGESGLPGLSLDGLQLRKLLLHVDAGEEVLALLHLGVQRQSAPFGGAVPGLAGGVGADLGEDLGAGVGHEGREQHGSHPNSLQQVIKNGGKAGAVGLHVLGEGPGGVLVDILVGPLDGLEDLLQAVLELVLVHLCLIAVTEALHHGEELVIQRRGFTLAGQPAAEILLHHGGGAAHQVAQVVGQIHIDGLDQKLVGEVAVGAEGEGPHEEEAEGVHAEVLRQDIGIHHVALALAHLAAVQKEPAVAVDLLRQGQIQAHEHGRPDDGVEADDLLAHEVDVGRPELLQTVTGVILIAQSGHVVEEGIDPHIDHVLGVEVHRHAPGEAGAGDAEILQTGLDEVVHHLVDTAAGLQEVGVLQKILDTVGILGEAEEIGLLLRILDFTAAVGALAVHQLALRPEGLAGLAVLALVGVLVDVAVVVHLLEDLLDSGFMVVVGGADEAVVGDVHELPEVLDPTGALHDIVHELLGGDPGLLGLILDLLTVLVGAGQEHDVVSLEPLVPGHGVGGHGAVGVADVETAGGVVDRRRDIKFLIFHWVFPPNAPNERA